MVKVWDPVVRIFHWTCACIFMINYWWIEDGPVHRWLGYIVVAFLCIRFVWGFIGTPYARFSDFFPTPRRIKAYVADSVAHRRPPSAIGHNPFGALMIFTLLGLLSVLSLSGWMIGLDVFWGVDWVEDLHEVVAHIIQFLVVIHVAAVFISDVVFKENLIVAMITGKKNDAG